MGRWLLPDGTEFVLPGIDDEQEATRRLKAKYAGGPLPTGAMFYEGDFDPEELAGMMGGKTEEQMRGERVEGMVRGGLEGGGAALGNVFGTVAGGATGPLAPVMSPLGRAALAPVFQEGGRQIGNWIYGEPEKQPGDEEWFERWGKTAAISLGSDTLLGALKYGTALSSGNPEVVGAYNLFKKYGTEPTVGQITGKRVPNLIEGAMRYNIVTANLYEREISETNRRLGEQFLKVMPKQRGADIVESFEMAQAGLRALNRRTFGKADAEFAKIWTMAKPDDIIPTPRFQAAMKQIHQEHIERYFKEGVSEDLLPILKRDVDLAGEFFFQDLKAMRSDMGERMASSSEALAKGIKDVRGMGTKETRAWGMLRRALDEDLAAIKPEVAAQMSKARGMYNAAKKLYEKKTVKDVLFALEKDQPGLITNRFIRPEVDIAKLRTLKQAMGPKHFEELVAAKVTAESTVEGQFEPSKIMSWIAKFSDDGLKEIATRPGQYEALKDFQKIHRMMAASSLKGANPSGTAQIVTTTGLLGTLAAAFWNPKIALKLIASATAGYSGAWIYFKPIIAQWTAEGLLSQRAANFIASTLTGGITGSRSYWEERERRRKGELPQDKIIPPELGFYY